MTTRKQKSKPATAAIDPQLEAFLAQYEEALPEEAIISLCARIRAKVLASDANKAALAAFCLGQLIVMLGCLEDALKEKRRRYRHRASQRSRADQKELRKARAVELFRAYSEKDRQGRLTRIYKEIAAKISAQFPPQKVTPRTVRAYLSDNG
jgi:2-keto-3-deoxy-galactonokinase